MLHTSFGSTLLLPVPVPLDTLFSLPVRFSVVSLLVSWSRPWTTFLGVDGRLFALRFHDFQTSVGAHGTLGVLEMGQDHAVKFWFDL